MVMPRRFFTMDVRVSHCANRVSVGVMYMIKLHHMVDDKLHARSVGPYSMVANNHSEESSIWWTTFREMEVWAHGKLMVHQMSLQEILTYKSDDVNGRLKAYEAITKVNQFQNQVYQNPSAFLSKNCNLLVLTCVSWTKMIRSGTS